MTTSGGLLLYTQFASIYDRLMQDIDYPLWARHYLALLARSGVEPRRACECACGTGLLSVELARMGLSLTASDLSVEMLELAADRARKNGLMIPFIAQDMRNLALHRPVDAVICACDGVNYLHTDADLRAFFSAAHRALRPGGALAFDISSEHKLRDMCDQREFFEDTDDLTYLWTNTWDAQTRSVCMDLCCFVRGHDGRYDRFDEHQRQRVHDIPSLAEILSQQGFSDIRCYGDHTTQPPTATASRIHLVATRQPASR